MCLDRMLTVNLMYGLVCLARYRSDPTSFCRSSGPCLRYVLSEVSNSNLLEFLRFCVDPFETAQALFLCSVLGQLWLCPLLVWFLDPETSVISLCLPCGMLHRVSFWHRRSLSYFLMLQWCRQPRPRWRCDPLPLILEQAVIVPGSGEPLSQ